MLGLMVPLMAATLLVVVASQIVLGLQTIQSRQVNVTTEPSVLTVAIFNAGNRFNIIPDKAELEGTLRLAEARGDEAEHRLRVERAELFRAEVRVVELEVALERRLSDQIDELAEWPGDEVDTVVDLLNWEQRVDAEERRTRSA